MNRLHDEIYAADFLGCSVPLLRRMRLEGRGPRYTRVGRLVRYPEEWLIEYVNQNAVGGTTTANKTGPFRGQR